MSLIGNHLTQNAVDMGYKNSVTIPLGPKEDPFEILRFEDWKKKQDTSWIKIVKIPLVGVHSITTNITISKTNEKNFDSGISAG